ncbi:hypothetical protein [Miltoncostaea marina]|uniref:hypothetical protein n=1 Tax=Miltoncostaea marina TaxID=2843215 RepID=UPI001C3C9EC3|nr:hypothetical protein [Miltoncostaea marina]
MLTPAGERIQVKSLRRTSTGRRTNLSPVRDAEYDQLLIVIFDEDFNVTEGLRLPRAAVERLFDHDPYVNGRIVRVTRRMRADPEVEAVDLSSVLLPGEHA